MHRIFFILGFYLLPFTALAQTWEAGISIGTSGYMGDINPVKPYNFTDRAIGGLIKHNFNGYWSAKAGFVQAMIRAHDANSNNPQQRDRNLHFRSNLSELSLQVEFNLFNYLPGELPGFGSRRFSPFIFTGVSGITFNPVTNRDTGEEIELQPLQTEGVDYKKYALSVPYGVGVKYNIKGSFNIIGELGYRTAFTDYLDDVSGKYLDFSVVLPASPLTEELASRSGSKPMPGTQRGDFRPRDTYMFALVSLTYTFVPAKCFF
jgi:hypothetical protein